MTVGEVVKEWQVYYDDGVTPMALEDLPLVRAIRNGEIVKDMELVQANSKGDRLWLLCNAGPIYGTEEEIIGGIVAWHDISERKQVERQKEELLEHERLIANTLQDTILSEPIKDIPCCEVAVKYQPAFEEARVGGDFYDIFSVGENKYGILIGDVAGKGLIAARQVAAVRYAVKNYSYIETNPSKIMTLTNNALVREAVEESPMVTAFFALADADKQEVTYVNAGHECVLLTKANGEIEELYIPGLVFGIVCDYEYEEKILNLEPGDTLVMITDGITEARTISTELFGIDGVKKSLKETYKAAPDEIADSIFESAKEFGGGELRDDAAIVVFRFLKKDSR
jgi:serine phosphatase RsbU (regulator of sigma subunit)